ncbi:MAG: hypothetical protein QOC82_2531 [Frankiaceae bacterium]|jgi:hypothetical protein|nr:hypothetical protein [Frankiaceae bacterium]
MRVNRIILPIAAALFAVTMTTPASATTNSLGLHGTITGKWHVDPNTLADAGQHYLLFRGYGQTSLGVTGARGESSSLGNVRSSNCAVNLRVTTATPEGTISVLITSLDQFSAGASCKSYNFRWHSTKVTGAYAGKSGSGTGSFGMRNPATSGGDGTFKVYFH